MSQRLTQKDRTNYVRNRLKEDPKWALRALVVIYNHQTESEQATETTHFYNNVGFAGNDAPLFTSLAKQFIRSGTLSEKQMWHVMRKMHKYSRQIIDNSDKSKLDPMVSNALDTQMLINVKNLA